VIVNLSIYPFLTLLPGTVRFSKKTGASTVYVKANLKNRAFVTSPGNGPFTAVVSTNPKAMYPTLGKVGLVAVRYLFLSYHYISLCAPGDVSCGYLGGHRAGLQEGRRRRGLQARVIPSIIVLNCAGYKARSEEVSGHLVSILALARHREGHLSLS
jgi:hypothetical protein